ncbi:hypothetical protein BDZ89DRAFT_1116139 [Hymenopellis radicata]|nr:hypothetical protein BDZ89DRAFT_1116139 [Hymenopellis radicata]
MSTTQRSTRAKVPKSYAESDGDQDQESDYAGTATESEGDVSAMTASPKKRKRAGGKPTSKRRRTQLQGRLEDFKKLPVELKLCIFEMLHPKTLILMSRTNQEYRNFLLSADSVWKQSRLRLGMPDLLAKDITERQYILLMFDKTCHGRDCYQLHVQDMDWVSCARLCASCRRWTKMTRGKLRRYIATLHPRAQACAKETGEGGIPRGIVRMSERLWRMTAQETTDFVQERQALKACIVKDAKNIRDWICEESAAQYGSDNENRQAREGQIKERLLALGWTEDSLSMTSWRRNPRVTQPRRLTEAIWRRIEDPLLQDMYPGLINVRNHHRRNALRPKYQELLESHPAPDVFPSHRIFLEFPSVKGVWEETTNPLPDSIDVADFVLYDDAKWVAALPAIQADVLRYQDEMEALAIARLTAAYVAQSLSVPSPAEILDDPRSLFCYVSGDRSWSLVKDDDIIMPFPAIHREIRDKYKQVDYGRFHRVDEFETLEEPSVLGRWGLHVQLKL